MRFQNKRIFLACGHTDMRKSINGLTLLVQSSFDLNPFEEALFVFCNKSRDCLKILEWDGDGFWLYLKRLEKGHFKWPTRGEDKTIALNCEELAHLLEGPKLEQKLRRKEVTERLVV